MYDDQKGALPNVNNWDRIRILGKYLAKIKLESRLNLDRS